MCVMSADGVVLLGLMRTMPGETSITGMHTADLSTCPNACMSMQYCICRCVWMKLNSLLILNDFQYTKGCMQYVYVALYMDAHACSCRKQCPNSSSVVYYVAMMFVLCACLYGGISRSDTWHDRTMFRLCVWCVWPEVWTALTGSLSLLIGFRTSQSLTRFWESRRGNFWSYMQRPHGWQLNNSSFNHVTPTACEPLAFVCNFCVVLLPCFQQKVVKDRDFADVLRKGQACYIKCEVLSGKSHWEDRTAWQKGLIRTGRHCKDQGFQGTFGKRWEKRSKNKATKELKKQCENHVEGLQLIQTVLQDLKIHYAYVIICACSTYLIYIYIICT